MIKVMAIKEYIEHMNDELHGAKEYYEYAKEYPKYKDIYKTMASQELGHFKDLESMMMSDMSEEDKSNWNDIVKMLYSVYTEKYDNLKEEIEEL